MNKAILQVLVGSRAHGLDSDDSDWDYRGVFVTPTSEILKLGSNHKTTSWIEGKEDNTSWEVGHFLNMAIHCNPTILECFLAPYKSVGLERLELGSRYFELQSEIRALFPHVWNSKGVLDAFCGYSHNQRKKMLDNKDDRAAKYAVAYGRTLVQAKELLTTGTFSIKISATEHGDMLKKWKRGEFSYGEVIDFCEDQKKQLDEIYKSQPKKETNMEPVNEFLLKVRKEFWE